MWFFLQTREYVTIFPDLILTTSIRSSPFNYITGSMTSRAFRFYLCRFIMCEHGRFSTIIRVTKRPINQSCVMFFFPSINRSRSTQVFRVAISSTISPSIITSSQSTNRRKTITPSRRIYLCANYQDFMRFLCRCPINGVIRFNGSMYLFSLSLILSFLISRNYRPFTRVIKQRRRLLRIRQRMKLLCRIRCPICFPRGKTVYYRSNRVNVRPYISFVGISNTSANRITGPYSSVCRLKISFRAFRSRCRFSSYLLRTFTPTSIKHFIRANRRFSSGHCFFSILYNTSRDFRCLQIFNRTVRDRLSTFRFFTSNYLTRCASRNVRQLVKMVRQPILFPSRSRSAFHPIRFLFRSKEPNEVFRIKPSTIKGLRRIFRIVVTPTYCANIIFVRIRTINRLSRRVFQRLFIVSRASQFTPFPTFSPLQCFLRRAYARVAICLRFNIFNRLRDMDFVIHVVRTCRSRQRTMTSGIIRGRRVNFTFQVQRTSRTSRLNNKRPSSNVVFRFRFSLAIFTRRTSNGMSIFVNLIIHVAKHFDGGRQVNEPVRPIPMR